MPEPSDRTRLPIRREPFQGRVNRTLDGSEPDWATIAPVRAPERAPNVLLVLIDDAGFGNPSTFGGPIATPNYTRLAEEGLRYNRFHVTAMCSPTRASLLTGRNSHTVGFGSIGEFSNGFPGYTAILPRDCAPLPRILRDNGYSTAAIGKWHLTPDGQQGAAGPFDRWPTGGGSTTSMAFSAAAPANGTPSSPRTRRSSARRRTSTTSGPVLFARRHGRQDHRVAARSPRPGCRQAVLRLLLHRMRSRAASRAQGVGRQVPGAGSTSAGTGCASRSSPARSNWA